MIASAKGTTYGGKTASSVRVKNVASSDKVKATFDQVNTTGNKRTGKAFRTEVRPGGELHIYSTGERVFVKKAGPTPNQATARMPRPGKLPAGTKFSSDGKGNSSIQVPPKRKKKRSTSGQGEI